LRLISLPGPFFRIDAQPVAAWSWVPFAAPRYRFDSATGACRVRYAARSDEGAARERYRDSGSMIPADHAGHHLVTLTGRVRVLDVRGEATLDLLELDDQISTSRADPWFDAAHRLTDSIRAWWGDHVEGIAYRSRTTPETSTNLAFFEHAPLAGVSQSLAQCAELLDRLVLARGFAIDFPY
jgi:hypothetical protein